jgi:predicted RNA-binding protein with PIN domain
MAGCGIRDAGMSASWVLVDGYSVIHNWLQLRMLAGHSLHHQRLALTHVLRQYADHSGRRVTVVFDGYAAKHKPGVPDPEAGLEVIFSASGKTADDVIERLVGRSPTPDQIVVITSDNQERRTVESLGAQSRSTEMFETDVQTELQELARLVRQHSRARVLGRLREEFER